MQSGVDNFWGPRRRVVHKKWVDPTEVEKLYRLTEGSDFACPWCEMIPLADHWSNHLSFDRLFVKKVHPSIENLDIFRRNAFEKQLSKVMVTEEDKTKFELLIASPGIYNMDEFITKFGFSCRQHATHFAFAAAKSGLLLLDLREYFQVRPTFKFIVGNVYEPVQECVPGVGFPDVASSCTPGFVSTFIFYSSIRTLMIMGSLSSKNASSILNMPGTSSTKYLTFKL